MSDEEKAMIAQVLPPEDMDEMVAIDDVFNPLSDLEADIVIDDQMMTDTERNRTQTLLLNMAQTYGPEVIPVDLIMEFTDNPVRNKVLANLQRMAENPPPEQEG